MTGKQVEAVTPRAHREMKPPAPRQFTETYGPLVVGVLQLVEVVEPRIIPKYEQVCA